MIPNPILKVLSSIHRNGVTCLLMGGQACVLYGGAEFSRDTDLAVLADAGNLARLQAALDELEARRIAVPPFEFRFLDRGLAVHFRCHHRDAENLRIDIMSKMRGMDAFPELWKRRTTVEIGETRIEVLSLPDLVQAKKTQRDKDWPMIVRLVEASYFAHRADPNDAQLRFWLRELRTAALLIETAQTAADICRQEIERRPLLVHACSGDASALQAALRVEEADHREADRRYWAPLKRELEQLRRAERNRF